MILWSFYEFQAICFGLNDRLLNHYRVRIDKKLQVITHITPLNTIPFPHMINAETIHLYNLAPISVVSIKL